MTSTQPSTRTKIGHGLAKVLGIKLNYRNPTGTEDLTRGESVFSVSSADTYVEEEPTLAELAPQFGLYSSFMGVLVYWFFATSKDITIGVSARPMVFLCTGC